MIDIYVAIAIMIAVSSLFFSFTLIIVSKFRRRIADFFAVLTMIAMLLYIAFLWDKAEISWFVPYPNAIILGNWFPVITAVLSAIVYHRIRRRGFRKYAPLVVLNLIGVYAMLHPIIGNAPACANKVDQLGVARQSSEYTCSPTSAVNLLKIFEISSTESEMARLCLTKASRTWLGFSVSEGGTSWMGLYRGLQLKLADTKWHAVFFSESFAEFSANPKLPVIMSLKLPFGLAETDPARFSALQDAGWQPGLEHNVVIKNFTGHQSALTLDPKVGLEDMPLEDLRALWVGRGMYLEVR